MPEMWLGDPAAKTIDVLVHAKEGFARRGIFGESDTVCSVVLEGLEFGVAPVFRPI
jgi:hypothetical protein